MKKKQEKVNFTITATIASSGKQVTYNVISPNHLVMLDPKDNRSEIADIMIADDGTVTTKARIASRWPEDAGKCMLECTRGCNGDLWCVAECGALCSTIIIG